MSHPSEPPTFPDEPEGFVAPRYDAEGLAGVVPGILASLAMPRPASAPAGWPDGTGHLPPARRAVVVLLDGAGHELLLRRSGHTPFLRALRREDGYRVLTSGLPSTTATSLGAFGTGRTPGEHGLVGYEVLDPDTGRVVNQLSWDGGAEPTRWQPEATAFELASGSGVEVSMVSAGSFDGSGLTRAVLRGARFVAAQSLTDRVDATLSLLRTKPARGQATANGALVYLYWGDVDRAAHVHGIDSLEVGDELENVDRELARLARSLPKDTALYVTADHGMVDIPHAARVELSQDRELDADLLAVGGELRFRHLYCRPGAAEQVASTWRRRFAGQAWIRTREEAVAQGWFGPPGSVLERVLPRIGDVVVAFAGPVGVQDARRTRPVVLSLLGQHGSATAAEIHVPLFVRPAASGSP